MRLQGSSFRAGFFLDWPRCGLHTDQWRYGIGSRRSIRRQAHPRSTLLDKDPDTRWLRLRASSIVVREATIHVHPPRLRFIEPSHSGRAFGSSTTVSSVTSRTGGGGGVVSASSGWGDLYGSADGAPNDRTSGGTRSRIDRRVRRRHRWLRNRFGIDGGRLYHLKRGWTLPVVAILDPTGQVWFRDLR